MENVWNLSQAHARFIVSWHVEPAEEKKKGSTNFLLDSCRSLSSYFSDRLVSTW